VPTTDNELEQLKKTIEKKREKLADTEAQRTAREAEQANDIVAAQLRAEEARLDAALAEAARTAKASQVKGGAEGPLAAAKADMERALAQSKGQEDYAAAQTAEREAQAQAEKDAADAEKQPTDTTNKS
jgi:hypothetical protein